ncbi:head maturation protease [Aeromonas phage 4_D05]|uniref:DUF2213 domain-containing protein n=1 Tax=Aeromonas phage 4_D05 TaxID=2588099 RepID=A0A514TUD1_9CAUD|nr:head maturation protease [Aeromonas phage 4_D05]QDJ96161.1 hypothetical protein 4D05_048 [Aeromonas phage 4_D05]
MMAFDRQSARSIDADGRLHVSKTNISKAVVNPYYGREIPGWQQLGLEDDKVYRLYRDPEELAKGAGTFNNLPILNKHIPVTVDAPQKDNVVGSIGSDVVFDAPYLQASLCIWDAAAIAGVESEKQCELSCGYRYDPDMTPGTTSDGETYDGVMRNIRGNHLALVEVGRAGPDVVVADSDPFRKNTDKPKKETPAMKMTKLGKALALSLQGLSPKIAQDSALPALVGEAKKETFKKAAVLKGLLAMDSEIDAEKADEIIDAVIGVEDSPEAVELDRELGQDEPDLMGFLAGKLSPEDLEAVKGMMTPAKDEDYGMKPEAVEEKVTAAMDSMRVEFRQLEQAKVDVRPVVGDVIGMDSAEEVYRFALGKMGHDHKDMPAAGLRTMFNAVKDVKASRPAPRIAEDSAATVQKFNLGRFGQA